MNNILGYKQGVAKKITFATFFPLCENIHLPKDVGMIPYILYRDYGYDSYLISYRNGNYPYLKTEVPGLKLLFIKHTNRLMNRFLPCSSMLNTVLDIFPLILKYGKKINVFGLYYFRLQSIIIALIYKLINKRGCVFLKLDAGFPDTSKLNETTKERHATRIKNYFFRKLLRWVFDIIAVETLSSYEHIKTTHPSLKWVLDRMHHIPNGIDASELSSLTRYYNKFYDNKKENIILHIGRVGSYQKATEIVLEAFSKVAGDFPNWKLTLAGIMDGGFIDYYNKFLKIHENIRERIVYLGFVKSREEVYMHYWRCKILAFPSRYETFSMVPVEAGFFKDVILGSDIPCIMESTDNGKFGYLCPVDNVECFSETLRYMLSHEDEMDEKSEKYRRYTIVNFNWNRLCGYLNDIILKTKDIKV